MRKEDSVYSFTPFIMCIRSLHTVDSLVDDISRSWNKESLAMMLFSNLTTILEAYLCDNFIRCIKSDVKFLKNLVSHTEFTKDKYTLKQFIEGGESVEDIVIEKLNNIVWHNYDLVFSLYDRALDIKVPLDRAFLYKSRDIRHDIVHRNGYTKDGELVKINLELILDLKNKIQMFVEAIDGEITAKNA